MRTWVKGLIIFVVISSILIGCGKVENSTGEQPKEEPKPSYSGEMVKDATIKNGENGSIEVQYTLKNDSGVEVQYEISSGLTVDYIVFDEHGEMISQLSREIMSTMAIQTLKLKQGEVLEEAFSIGSLPDGKYSIQLFLTSAQQEELVEKEFSISNSMYQRMTGKLIEMNGDVATVEIGEEPVPFQLTDIAKDQLMTIEEDGFIEFIYVETEYEEKTIERIIFIEYRTHVHLDKSVLEVEQELAKVVEQIKANPNVLEGLKPFEIFTLYMYVLAGEDYETLYHFYLPDSMDIPVEEYVKQNRDGNVEAHRSFMRQFNEVRDFTVITKDQQGRVEFSLEGEQTGLAFQLRKQENTWYVMPMPLQ